jgi:hypothetical protein
MTLPSSPKVTGCYVLITIGNCLERQRQFRWGPAEGKDEADYAKAPAPRNVGSAAAK